MTASPSLIETGVCQEQQLKKTVHNLDISILIVYLYVKVKTTSICSIMQILFLLCSTWYLVDTVTRILKNLQQLLRGI